MLAALVARTDLTAEQATWAMGEILAGEATPAQIAGFAVSLRAKGETVDEVTGLVDAMYERATPIDVPGGCSTWSAPAATGPCRSTSRRWPRSSPPAPARGWSSTATARRPRSPARPTCSRRSAIRLDLPPDRVAALADEAGITFLFAAAFNPAMRHTAVPRRELGIGTTFNFLGPLANPTRPAANAIGCADPRMAPVMAGVFARPRSRRLGVPR